jgi:peptide deformylase
MNGAAIGVMDALSLARLRNEPGAVYELRVLGDPILHERCAELDGSADVKQFVELTTAMKRIAGEHNGLGLSANQVGSLARVFVLRVGAHPYIPFVNPRIERFEGEQALCVGEGCLSIPGFRTSTRRYPRVWLSYAITPGGERRELPVSGETAQAVQHEIDHLDGKLIVDGVSRQQRRQAERCVADWQRSHASDRRKGSLL